MTNASFDLSGVDIWTIDHPMIRELIGQRNTLRRSAGLPLVDEDKEFDHACMVILGARLHALWEANKAEFWRIFNETRDGPIRSLSHRRIIYYAAKHQFDAYMQAHFAEEIAAARQIHPRAPNHLAITRAVVEGD